MATIQRRLDFEGQAVILFMDMTYDDNRGVYCREWQVYEAPAHQYPVSRRELKELDIRLLPADDLIELAKEIEAAIQANQYGFDAFQGIKLNFKERL